MVNFIVVEDNKIHKKRLRDIIVSFMMNNNSDFKIQFFDDSDENLIDAINHKIHDTIYILDLELPNGDGIDIARSIRNTDDWKSPIIICTAHTSLAYGVYKQKLQILDFIGKDKNFKENIQESLKICIKILNDTNYYKFTYHNIDYKIDYTKIDYIQRFGRKTMLVTKDENYYQNITIKNILKRLPNNFVLCNKGVIVNKENIKKIDWKELIIYFNDNKKDYIISKKHRKDFENYECS